MKWQIRKLYYTLGQTFIQRLQDKWNFTPKLVGVLINLQFKHLFLIFLQAVNVNRRQTDNWFEMDIRRIGGIFLKNNYNHTASYKTVKWGFIFPYWSTFSFLNTREAQIPVCWYRYHYWVFSIAWYRLLQIPSIDPNTGKLLLLQYWYKVMPKIVFF